MGVCLPNFRSVSFFVWPGDVAQINTYTNIQVKLGISSTSCSPHVDFENLNAIIEGRKIKHFLNSLWTSVAGREHFRKTSITAVSQNIFEFFRTNLCQRRFFMYTQMVYIAFITLVGMSKLKYREFEQFLSVNLIYWKKSHTQFFLARHIQNHALVSLIFLKIKNQIVKWSYWGANKPPSQ